MLIVEQLRALMNPVPHRTIRDEIISTMQDGEVWTTIKLSEKLEVTRTVLHPHVLVLEKQKKIQKVSPPKVRPARYKLCI